jgi:3'-5' exoribonuclease
MGEKVLVRDLGEYLGSEITAQFLVLQSTKKLKKDGTHFVEVLLSDETGHVAGVLFDEVETFENFLKRGSVVEVRGVVGEFGGNLRIKLIEVREVEGATPEDFLRRSPRDINVMVSELKDLIHSIKDGKIRAILERVFLEDEDFLEQFKWSPAAKKFHHPYVGGLLEHTLSVTQLALRVSNHYPQIKRDLLIAGALLHDIGKVDEYAFTPVTDKTDPGRLLGHLVLGYERVKRIMDEMGDIPKDTRLQILHMILSHHGRLDFGSPIIPQTLEAQVLHYIDDLDAKVWMFAEAKSEPREDTSRWSKFHRGLERYVFIGEVEEESHEEGEEQIDLFR